jgi:hypothetical protein
MADVYDCGALPASDLGLDCEGPPESDWCLVGGDVLWCDRWLTDPRHEIRPGQRAVSRDLVSGRRSLAFLWPRRRDDHSPPLNTSSRAEAGHLFALLVLRMTRGLPLY